MEYCNRAIQGVEKSINSKTQKVNRELEKTERILLNNKEALIVQR